MGNVVGDLSSRRGTILEMKDCPAGKRIKADVPVAECFGYTAALRDLTEGRGNHKFEFTGYRPNEWPLRPDPNSVA
jgi:elongation factor G